MLRLFWAPRPYYKALRTHLISLFGGRKTILYEAFGPIWSLRA